MKATKTSKTTAQQEHEKALDRYMMYMGRIEEALESIKNKLTDNVAPEDVTWGHVTWIADLTRHIEELDREF